MSEEITRVKTQEETDAHCPMCSGVMIFNPDQGVLSCPYCDYRQEIPRETEEGKKSSALLQELSFAQAEERGSCDWGKEQKTVSCQSCGAQVVYDALEVASVCPYCGSNHVMEAKGEHTLAPNGVVPFQVTKDEAGESFTKWIKGRFFAPNVVRNSAKAEAFKGLYLPYWTFDAHTLTTYRAQYGKDRKVKDRDGKEKTVTDWYPTSGVYTENVDDELVAASNRYDEKIMRQVEPFDCAKGTAYKPEFLSGYGAERYAIGLEDGWKVAQKRIESRLDDAIERKIRRECHADHVRHLSMNTNYSKITYKYMMLPLWMSAFKFKDKMYQFMVNGQTGKVGGESPVSGVKVAVTVAAVVLVLGLLIYLVRR